MRSQAATTLQAFDGVPTDQAATYLELHGIDAQNLTGSGKKGPERSSGVAREVSTSPQI